MGAICLFLASGALAAAIPTESFTLTWTHSVEKTEWRERYVARDGRLVLAEAAVRGSGAGMEPPEGSRLSGGWWRYSPDVPPLDVLRLARSSFTADYRLCWDGRCTPMSDLIAVGEQPTLTIVSVCQNEGAGK